MLFKLDLCSVCAGKLRTILQVRGEDACTDPACGLMLTPRCHPRAGVTVKFYKSAMVLQVSCAKCDALVTQLALDGARLTDGTMTRLGPPPSGRSS